MKTFEELGLSREFISVLEKTKIKTPSEIQEKTIPLVLAGKDVIGGSATGSGKTLAFASGIIENFQKNGKVQALILTPTRELAEQVAYSIKNFSHHKKLNVLPVYGGINIETQIRRIKDADIVVGTPGRILDHLQRRTLNLENIKFLVLDEVDRMFDMGFQKDVEIILNKCPKKRQTMLFSATISPEIDYLAKKYTQKPEEISVKSHIDPSKLKQIYYNVPDGLKFSLLVHLLKKEKSKLVMVFCGTRHNADFVTNNLINLGIKAKAIHGGMIQNKRNKVLNEFNSYEGVNILVCTDVAARGLDIPRVSHVYNYDLPKTSTEYIHRIGRTARAEKNGIAISILSSRDYENFGNILKDKQLKIEEVETPYIEKVNIVVENKRRFSNRRGRENFNRERNNKRQNNFRKNPPRNNPESKRNFRRNQNRFGKRVSGKEDERNFVKNKHRGNRESNQQRNSRDNKNRHNKKRFRGQR